MTQPNALAAITAALTGNQPPVVTPATLPVQSTPFAFVPQGVAVPLPSNPFQPTPVQAQAAFVAAVPRGAEQHSHPQTGVTFAPINPPGEATSAPTVGLDAAPIVVNNVQTVAAPTADAAPKAPRARKPRNASADAAPDLSAQRAGAGAVETVVESVGPSDDVDEGRAPTADTNLRSCLETLQACLPEGCTLTVNGK